MAGFPSNAQVMSSGAASLRRLPLRDLELTVEQDHPEDLLRVFQSLPCTLVKLQLSADCEVEPDEQITAGLHPAVQRHGGAAVGDQTAVIALRLHATGLRSETHSFCIQHIAFVSLSWRYCFHLLETSAHAFIPANGAHIRDAARLLQVSVSGWLFSNR